MFRGQGTFPPDLGHPTDPNEPASWDDHESMKCKIEREWRQYQERQYQEQCGYQKVKPQDNVQAWPRHISRENHGIGIPNLPLARNALLDYQQQLDHLEGRGMSATTRPWSSSLCSRSDCPGAACRQRYQFGLQLLEAQGRARWEKAKQERNDTDTGEECRQQPRCPPAQASDPAPPVNPLSEVSLESARAKPIVVETAQLPPTSDIPNNEQKPAEISTGSSAPLEMASGEKLEEWELVRPYERNGPSTETVTGKNEVVPNPEKEAANYLDTFWEKQVESLQETIAKLRSGPRDAQARRHITDAKWHLTVLEELYGVQVAEPRE